MIQAALSNLLVVVLFISLALWIVAICVRTLSAFNALSRTRLGTPSTLFTVELDRLLRTPLADVVQECQITAKQGVHMMAPSVLLPVSCSSKAAAGASDNDAPAIFPPKSHGLQRWGMRRRGTAAVQRSTAGGGGGGAGPVSTSPVVSRRPSASMLQASTREGRLSPPRPAGATGLCQPFEELLTSPIRGGVGERRTPPHAAGQAAETAGHSTPVGTREETSSRGIAAFLRTVWVSSWPLVHGRGGGGGGLISSAFSDGGASISPTAGGTMTREGPKMHAGASYALPPALSMSSPPPAAVLVAGGGGGGVLSGTDSSVATINQHQQRSQAPRPLDGNAILVPSGASASGAQCTTPPMIQFALPGQHRGRQSSSASVGGAAEAGCGTQYRISILLTSEECLEEELLYAANVFRHERSLWLSGHGAPIPRERGQDNEQQASLRVCAAMGDRRCCRCHTCGTQMVPPRGGGRGGAPVAKPSLDGPCDGSPLSLGHQTSSGPHAISSAATFASEHSEHADAPADVECRIAFSTEEWAALIGCCASAPPPTSPSPPQLRHDDGVRNAYLVVEELDCAALTPPKNLRPPLVGSPSTLEASSADAAAMLSTTGGGEANRSPSCTLIYRLQLNMKGNTNHTMAVGSNTSVAPVVSDSSSQTNHDEGGGVPRPSFWIAATGPVAPSSGGANTAGRMMAPSPSPQAISDAIALPTVLERTARFADGEEEGGGEEMVSLSDVVGGGGSGPFHATAATPDVSVVMPPSPALELLRTRVVSRGGGVSLAPFEVREGGESPAHPSSAVTSREPSVMFPTNSKGGLLRLLRPESPSVLRDDSVGAVFGGGGVGLEEDASQSLLTLHTQQQQQQQQQQSAVDERVYPALADVQLSMAFLRINHKVYRTEPIYEIHDSDDYGDEGGTSQHSHHHTEAAATSELCIVCYHHPRSVILMPCNHFAFCVACVRRLSYCPVCREAIQFTLYLLQE